MLAVLIVLAVLSLILSIPVIAEVFYDSAGLKVTLKIWFKHIKILPKRPETQNKSAKPKKLSFSFSEWIDIAGMTFNTLRRLTSKLNIGVLKLRYISAGDDPFEVVSRYNAMSAAVRTIYPFLNLKESDIKLGCDFEAEKSNFEFAFNLKIRIFHLMFIAPATAYSMLKLLLKNRRKQRKGNSEAKNGKQTQQHYADNNFRYQKYG